MFIKREEALIEEGYWALQIEPLLGLPSDMPLRNEPLPSIVSGLLSCLLIVGAIRLLVWLSSPDLGFDFVLGLPFLVRHKPNAYQNRQNDKNSNQNPQPPQAACFGRGA